MYAKFILYKKEFQLKNKNDFVPSTSQLFEGERMSYEKIFINSIEDWYKNIEGTTHQILTDIPICVKNEPKLEENFEFIRLTLYNSDGVPYGYIAADDSVLFIMNDQGKTIDSESCRNHH